MGGPVGERGSIAGDFQDLLKTRVGQTKLNMAEAAKSVISNPRGMRKLFATELNDNQKRLFAAHVSSREAEITSTFIATEVRNNPSLSQEAYKLAKAISKLAQTHEIPETLLNAAQAYLDEQLKSSTFTIEDGKTKLTMIVVEDDGKLREANNSSDKAENDVSVVLHEQLKEVIDRGDSKGALAFVVKNYTECISDPECRKLLAEAKKSNLIGATALTFALAVDGGTSSEKMKFITNNKKELMAAFQEGSIDKKDLYSAILGSQPDQMSDTAVSLGVHMHLASPKETLAFVVKNYSDCISSPEGRKLLAEAKKSNLIGTAELAFALALDGATSSEKMKFVAENKTALFNAFKDGKIEKNDLFSAAFGREVNGMSDMEASLTLHIELGSPKEALSFIAKNYEDCMANPQAGSLITQAVKDNKISKQALAFAIAMREVSDPGEKMKFLAGNNKELLNGLEGRRDEANDLYLTVFGEKPDGMSDVGVSLALHIELATRAEVLAFVAKNYEHCTSNDGCKLLLAEAGIGQKSLDLIGNVQSLPPGDLIKYVAENYESIVKNETDQEGKDYKDCALILDSAIRGKQINQGELILALSSKLGPTLMSASRANGVDLLPMKIDNSDAKKLTNAIQHRANRILKQINLEKTLNEVADKEVKLDKAVDDQTNLYKEFINEIGQSIKLEILNAKGVKSFTTAVDKYVDTAYLLAQNGYVEIAQTMASVLTSTPYLTSSRNYINIKSYTSGTTDQKLAQLEQLLDSSRNWKLATQQIAHSSGISLLSGVKGGLASQENESNIFFKTEMYVKVLAPFFESLKSVPEGEDLDANITLPNESPDWQRLRPNARELAIGAANNLTAQEVKDEKIYQWGTQKAKYLHDHLDDFSRRFL